MWRLFSNNYSKLIISELYIEVVSKDEAGNFRTFPEDEGKITLFPLISAPGIYDFFYLLGAALLARFPTKS